MTSRRLFISRGWVVLVGSLVAGVSAQDSRYPLPAESPAFAEAIDRGRTLVTGIVTAHRIPGFSVAVAVDGRVAWSEGFGMADAEQRVAVTPLTRFRLGSVSKVLTAAAGRASSKTDASIWMRLFNGTFRDSRRSHGRSQHGNSRAIQPASVTTTRTFKVC